MKTKLILALTGLIALVAVSCGIHPNTPYEYDTAGCDVEMNHATYSGQTIVEQDGDRAYGVATLPDSQEDEACISVVFCLQYNDSISGNGEQCAAMNLSNFSVSVNVQATSGGTITAVEGKIIVHRYIAVGQSGTTTDACEHHDPDDSNTGGCAPGIDA